MLKNKHILKLLIMGILVLAWIFTPIIHAHNCLCSPGYQDKDSGAARTGSSGLTTDHSCCLQQKTLQKRDSSPEDSDVQNSGCDTHSSCCRTSSAPPRTSGNQAVIQHDRRPSFQELDLQEMLSTTFSSETDRFAVRFPGLFNNNMAWIPAHISSTVLLI